MVDARLTFGAIGPSDCPLGVQVLPKLSEFKIIPFQIVLFFQAGIKIEILETMLVFNFTN